jgi:hypothetical protein
MIKRLTLAAVLFGCIMLLLSGFALAQTETPQTPQGEQPPVQDGSQTASGQIYFYQNGDLTAVARDVAGGSQMAEFAVIELLKGPTDEEKAAGYVTFIPDGVKLQYSTIKQDNSEYSVCLSNELLALQSDSETAAKALAQIDKTLQDVTGISNIGITVAGQDMGSTPQDAYEALGVSQETGAAATSQSSGGNTALLIILIVIAVLLLAAVLFFFFYIQRKRKAKLPSGAIKGSKRPNNRTKK